MNIRLLPLLDIQTFEVIQLKWLYILYMCLLNHFCLLVRNHRPRRHPDPLKWRWSWSIWTRKSKTQSGRTRLVLTWRNAGWVSTTAILSPHASTLRRPSSVTVRGDTPEMARSTATRRERPRLSACSFTSALTPRCPVPICCPNPVFIPLTAATMSVVRASAVGARGSSVNAPSAGRLTQPPWFSAGWSVMSTVAATSTPPVSQHQGSAMNARVKPSYLTLK